MLKLTNENYSGTIVSIKNLVDLENCDNVVGMPMLGFQAIVGKSAKKGDLGVLFGAETQLSDDYCKNNNLYRHSELNLDPNEKGYIEDNRRIKAVKFRGHRSSALFMPLESLAYTGYDISSFKEGDAFNEINNHEVCNKYYNKKLESKNKVHRQEKKFARIDNKTFPEHFSTDNYFRYQRNFDNKDVIVTQKLHGTSIRLGNCLVRRPLNRYEKVLKFLGVSINDTTYDGIRGSRKVIKNQNAEPSSHYYKEDIWKFMNDKYCNLIPKDYIIYGEIIGWVGESPIQKNYTYQIPKNEAELYVYRITIVNQDGIQTDLSWKQIVEFCDTNGLKYVPVLFEGKHKKFKVEEFMDVRYEDKYKNAVPLDKESPCDEGVCIRYEAFTPYIGKAKAGLFMEHESKQLDTGEIDLETNESV